MQLHDYVNRAPKKDPVKLSAADKVAEVTVVTLGLLLLLGVLCL